MPPDVDLFTGEDGRERKGFGVPEPPDCLEELFVGEAMNTLLRPAMRDGVRGVLEEVASDLER